GSEHRPGSPGGLHSTPWLPGPSGKTPRHSCACARDTGLHWGGRLFFIPKGAKNVEVAKNFLKYLIQPKVANEYLKQGLGRFLPVMPDLIKDDPFWLDPKDPHRAAYTRQGLLGPTVSFQPALNPGAAELLAQPGSCRAD